MQTNRRVISDGLTWPGNQFQGLVAVQYNIFRFITIPSAPMSYTHSLGFFSLEEEN